MEQIVSNPDSNISKMARNSTKKEDLSILENELKSAIEQDKLYWIRNTAKINAVTTAKNYEEFRNIVDAAHLKPVDKEDKNKQTKTSWNKCI